MRGFYPGRPKNVPEAMWQQILEQADKFREVLDHSLECPNKLVALALMAGAIIQHIGEDHKEELQEIYQNPTQDVFKAFVRDLARFLQASKENSDHTPEPAPSQKIPVLVNKASTTVFH